jgi:SRSO17 transposase
VTLSIANHHGSLPIAHQLYLPKAWATDAARRRKAHVPKTVRFMTKPQIALKQITAALKAGVAPRVVLMDASYGTNAGPRFGIAALGLTYAAIAKPPSNPSSDFSADLGRGGHYDRHPVVAR